MSSSDDVDGMPFGAIVGIAIGVFFGLLLVGGIIFMFVKSSKENVVPKIQEHSPPV